MRQIDGELAEEARMQGPGLRPGDAVMLDRWTFAVVLHVSEYLVLVETQSRKRLTVSRELAERAKILADYYETKTRRPS